MAEVTQTELEIRNVLHVILPDANIYKRGDAALFLTTYFIKSQIDLLKTVVEHPNKPGYKRHDVLDKIKELEKQLQ